MIRRLALAGAVRARRTGGRARSTKRVELLSVEQPSLLSRPRTGGVALARSRSYPEPLGVNPGASEACWLGAINSCSPREKSTRNTAPPPPRSAHPRASPLSFGALARCRRQTRDRRTPRVFVSDAPRVSRSAWCESQIGARLAPNATTVVLPHDIRAKALVCERFLDTTAEP
jgi:hypothetical protein